MSGYNFLKYTLTKGDRKKYNNVLLFGNLKEEVSFIFSRVSVFVLNIVLECHFRATPLYIFIKGWSFNESRESVRVDK